MNRETKRRLQRQGQLGPDGAPGVATRRPPQTRPTPRPAGQRTRPMAFLREVRAELRKVAWPSRREVANYSLVVLFTLVFMITLIFVVDLGFSKSILFLFRA